MEKSKKDQNPERLKRVMSDEEFREFWAEIDRRPPSKLASEIAEALISGLKAGVEKQQKENPPDPERDKRWAEIINKWKVEEEKRLNKRDRKPPAP